MKEMRVWSLRVFSTLVLSSRNLKDWLSFGIRLMLRELGCLVGRLWSQTSFVGGGQTKHVAGWNMDHPTCFFSVSCVCVFAYIYIYIYILYIHIYIIYLYIYIINLYIYIHIIFTYIYIYCIHIYIYAYQVCMCMYMYVCIYFIYTSIYYIEWIFTWMDQNQAFQRIFIRDSWWDGRWPRWPGREGRHAPFFPTYRNSLSKGVFRFSPQKKKSI